LHTSPSSLPPFLIPCIVVFVAAWWVLICFSCSALTGWMKLSKRFRAESEPTGPISSVGPFPYSIYMRYWSHYSCLVRITAAEDGLYLSMLLPFRAFHPPLRIAWSEVRFGREKFFFRTYVSLLLGAQEQIPLRMTEGMARKLGILDKVM